MHIISYATIAQSQFPMVVKYNTVSLRHKHSPEILFIHINQCIHIVLAFTSNARQLIIHLKHFYQQKFHFFFENFVSFYSILFYLIFQIFFFRNLLFTVDRSTITVHGLLFMVYCSRITIHNLLFTDYCWSQYKNCIATHFQQPLLVLQYNSSLSPPIAIHFLMLQYNLTPSSKSQYNIVLQYKLSPQALFFAIQFCVLQYDF